MLELALEEIPLFVRIGVDPAERVSGQEVLVSLWFYTSQMRDFTSDGEQAFVLDYATVFDAVRRHEGREVWTVEALLQQLAADLTTLTRHSDVHRFEVAIRKSVLPKAVDRGARVSVRQSFELATPQP